MYYNLTYCFRYKGRVVYNKRYHDSSEISQASDASRPSSTSSNKTNDTSWGLSRGGSSSRRSSRISRLSDASSSVVDSSASYEPSVFSNSYNTLDYSGSQLVLNFAFHSINQTFSLEGSRNESGSYSNTSYSNTSDATTQSSATSREKPKRRRKRRNNRSRKADHGKSLTGSTVKDRFNFTKPLRLEVLLDLPPPSLDVQMANAWNPEDSSSNISGKQKNQKRKSMLLLWHCFNNFLLSFAVNEEDPFTLHRQPVAQSTDGIRSKQSYEQGMHLFEIRWPQRERGTHAVIGVCTAEAPLNSHGYSCLVGSNEESWGWDLSRNEIHHTSEESPSVEIYPRELRHNEKFVVPDEFKGMFPVA